FESYLLNNAGITYVALFMTVFLYSNLFKCNSIENRMRSKSLTFLNNWLPAIVLLLIFISEGVGKYYEFYYGTGFGFQKYLKAFLFVGFAGLLLKNAVDLIAPIGLMGLFLIGQVFLPGGMEPDVVISGFKFIFPILLFIYFNRNRMTAVSRENFFKSVRIG